MELITQALSQKQRMKLVLVNFWQSFSSVEKLYLVAFILLFVSPNSSAPSALITVIALTKEFWPRFTKLWDGLAGKAVILFFYAIVTNIALAYSAGLVNDITGVSASDLSYSHNIALLLIIPPCFIGVSFLSLLVFQIFYPFYLFALLCLKPFGVKAVSSLSKSAHPIFSHTIRFVLCTVLLLQIVDLDKNADTAMAEIDNAVEQVTQNDEAPAHLSSQISAQVNDQIAAAEPIKLTIKENGEEKSVRLPIDSSILNIPSDANYFDVIETLVANFIYHLEADSFSRCKHPEGSKVVELNDYEVLLITKNPAAKHQLDFSVVKCVSPAFPE
jgi:hypothetical protein